MKLFLGILTLVVGIVISGIAGYFSIVGLAALFAARFLPVVIMGTALEVGKLVAATWLKLNWTNRAVSILHKGYLLGATLILMIITSLGIFGFLSAGHLEQKAPMASLSIEQKQFKTKLEQAEASAKRSESRLAQIDANINAFLEGGSARGGLRASNQMKAERDRIQKKIDEDYAVINDMNAKLAPLEQQSSEVEAKLGPVKYLAEFLGYSDPTVAVNIVIFLIMIVFDPLAVVLVLSAMSTFRQIADEKASEPEEEPEQPAPVPDPEPSPEGESAEPIAPVDPDPIAPLIAEGTVPLEMAMTGDAEVVQPERRLTPSEIADIMAAQSRAAFAKGDATIAVDCSADAVSKSESDIRTDILDMLERYPTLVNELVEAARVVESETKSRPSVKTIPEITGQ